MKEIEKYGVKVDRKLHQEALQRWKSLGIPKFSGFINPVLQPIKKNGKILDISMHYPENFSDQMLFYAKNYSFL
jgi:dipeptidyl-peptidase-3